MTTKHTPGPWKAWKDGSFIQVCTAEIPPLIIGQAPIATVDRRLNASSEANARLIAAAPELLEALRQACDLLDMAQSCVDNKRDSDRIYAGCVAGRSAIAKATTL